MTLENFFAEISTTFKIYEETGDLDRISIKGWVIDCLRTFGKNICEQNEAIIEIKNSQGNLPENFKSLILALKLNMDGCKVLGDRKKAENSVIWRERIEKPAYFDWITNEYVSGCDASIVTEKVIMNDQDVEFYYKPENLSVVKGFNKNSFEVDCINLHPSIRNAYPHQININNRTIQTNFREGRIYLQYNSLPMEDGEIAIPEYTTGSIVTYIENYVKIKIAENLILNGKNPTTVGQLLQMWLGKEREYRNAAKSEANFKGLNKNWIHRYQKKLQINTARYNLPKY